MKGNEKIKAAYCRVGREEQANRKRTALYCRAASANGLAVMAEPADAHV